MSEVLSMAKKLSKPLPPKPPLDESVERVLSKMGQDCPTGQYALAIALKVFGSVGGRSKKDRAEGHRTEGQVKATVRAFHRYMVAQGRDITLDKLIDTMDDEYEREEAIFGHDEVCLAPLEIRKVDRLHKMVWFVSVADEDAAPFYILFSTLGQYLNEIRNE
jgi:hypothetical protein